MTSWGLRAAFCAAVLAVSAQAGTNTYLGIWHLGESDSGAVSGGPGAATTVDSSGNSNNLSLVGTPAPIYTNLASPGSTLGMVFPGTSGYRGAAIPTSTSNWGVEIWAYSTTTAQNSVLIHNGNTGNAGYGIYQAGSNWFYLFGGVRLQQVAPVTLNYWTDLALVRDGSNVTMYVNGSPIAAGTLTPNPVSGNMMIGVNNSGGETFFGRLDEARLFTFTSPFDPTTLQIYHVISVPLMSGWGLGFVALLLVGTGLWMARHSHRAA